MTVKAERPPRASDVEAIAAERPRGVFSRQLILGDNLDTEHIAASHDSGVLTLQIPVAEQAKPRKISITSKGEGRPSTPEPGKPKAGTSFEAVPWLTPSRDLAYGDSGAASAVVSERLDGLPQGGDGRSRTPPQPR